MEGRRDPKERGYVSAETVIAGTRDLVAAYSANPDNARAVT
jgi:hypothetical protein